MRIICWPRGFFVFCILSSTLALAPAATLSLTPGSIPALYAGNITLQIGGLTNGETVLVEQFLDLNTNGVIDAGEPLVQSFRLTDGQAFSIGGARDGNVPGDNDLAANGQIMATVNFATGTEFGRAAGSHLYRVSSPGGRFTPVQQTLIVTQTAYPQQITGTIVSNGIPLPYAMAAVLVQTGNNSKFISGAPADGSGHFSLAVSNGTYIVVGFKPGCVGSFATGPMVTVSGANTNVTLPLAPATLTLSGSLTEATSNTPVPGVQFFLTSTNNEYAAMFTDAQGNFSINLTAGQWKLDESDNSLMLGGNFRAGNKTKITLTANQSGVQLNCYRGTAMIYGTLKDDQNNPLGGVQLNSNDNGNLYQSNATTDTNGTFYLMATPTTWNVGAGSSDSGLPAGDTLQNVQITLGTGQAVQTNLVAHHASAWLAGRAIDSNSNPINGGTILAFNGNNNSSASLGSDGSFALPVQGGFWTIELENGTAASRNLVGPALSYNVANGVNISNITYVAQVSTRTISGWVRTGSSAGVSGLNVFAGAMINGTNYQAGNSTDGSGNYSLPVLPGVWNVGLDTQGLAQRGYGSVQNQNADTTSANQTVNFVVGPAPMGTFFFRHNLGGVGEFGNSATPTVTYPVTIRNHRVFYLINDTNPPTADTVLFTGPPGSGLTNTPADINFSFVDPTSTSFYISPVVRNPAIATGGFWTITYKGSPNNFNVPDPQANSRIVVPLPTITLQNGLLRSVHWSYRDQNGNPIAPPAYIVTNRVDLFDQNVNGLDAELFPAATSYTYPATNQYPWADISTLRVDYYDNLTNQYFVAFSESSPSLTGPRWVPGQGLQFLLNGSPGQNFTIQYSTNLATTNWSTLYITNGLASPMSILDPNPPGPARFYRVLVGP